MLNIERAHKKDATGASTENEVWLSSGLGGWGGGEFKFRLQQSPAALCPCPRKEANHGCRAPAEPRTLGTLTFHPTQGAMRVRSLTVLGHGLILFKYSHSLNPQMSTFDAKMPGLERRFLNSSKNHLGTTRTSGLPFWVPSYTSAAVSLDRRLSRAPLLQSVTICTLIGTCSC